MMKCVLASLLISSVSAHGPTHAWDAPVAPLDVTSMAVDYEIDGEMYEGFIAYPTDAKGMLPGLGIAPAWYGLLQSEKFRAEEAAAHGYVAFAFDMYGKGIRATSPSEAGALSGALAGDVPTLQSRLRGGLRQLQETPFVNQSLLFGSGYCAGGLHIMELARLAAPLVGVAVFHANLANLTDYPDLSNLALQVHHAQNDFAFDDAGLIGFEQRLAAAPVGVWETVKYSNAAHGFTDPANDAFNARAASQSHASMFSFFRTLIPHTHDCSATWHKKDDPSKHCMWVKEKPDTRCYARAADGTLAMTACACTCPN